MKITERLAAMVQPIQELLQRLTQAQRVSLAILAAVVVIGMLTLIASSPSASAMARYPDLPTGETIAFLDEKQLDYELKGGRLYLDDESQTQLLLHRLETQRAAENTNEMDWLMQSLDLMDTKDHRKQKLSHTKQKYVARIIGKIEGIERANLVVEKARSRLGSGANASTAMVSVELEKGADRLPSRVANTVAKLVAASFMIPAKRVQVSDNRGNSYDYGDGSNASAEFRQSRQEEMRTKLEKALFDEYPFGHYRLVVDLMQETDRASIVDVKYDPDIVNPRVEEETRVTESSRVSGTPGTEKNVGFTNTQGDGDKNISREERARYEPKVGRKEETREVPAGKELEWRILATVSKEAIIQKLRYDHEELKGLTWEFTGDQIDTRINAELARLQRTIESFPAVASDATVTATVESFVYGSDLDAAPEVDSGFIGTVGTYGREIALVLLSLVAMFLLYKVAVGGVPVMEDLPDPVAEMRQFLDRRAEEDRVLQEQLDAERDEEVPNSPAEWSAPDEDRRDLELLEQIAGFTKERPEIASSVVRLWMMEGGDVFKKQGGPGNTQGNPEETTS